MPEDGADNPLRALRVLYVGDQAPEHYGDYRLRALRRLPLEHVAALDPVRLQRLSGIAAKLQFRLQVGPDVRRVNDAIVQAAQAERANILLADKVLSLRPETLRHLRGSGVFPIDFVIDNPFGPRHDPGWRLYRRAIPDFALTGVQRDASLEAFRRAGAKDVVRIRTSFEPSAHFPPPDGWSDAQRDRQVSFIGTPYDQRGDFLARLWHAGVPVDISGSRPHWQAALPSEAFAAVFRVGELIGDAYREAIWRSRINLAFVTHSNCDEVAHKAFEITACGGFLLAERTAEHQALFREDEEAVFFSSFEECQAKIGRYLRDEPARTRIAAAGRQRACCSGYDNDSVLRRLLTQAAAMRTQSS